MWDIIINNFLLTYRNKILQMEVPADDSALIKTSTSMAASKQPEEQKGAAAAEEPLPEEERVNGDI